MMDQQFQSPTEATTPIDRYEREKNEIMKIFLILAVICSASAAPEIEPALQNLASGATANIMVTLSNRTDALLASITARLDSFASRVDRIQAVHDVLLAHATLTQAPVTAALAPFSALIKTTSFWITNQISVTGATALVIRALSALPSISKIETDITFKLNSLANSGVEAQAPQNGTTTYGVAKVQAEAVWNLGFNGTGVLVANIDTGVRGTHQAFASRFLGTFGWYDPTSFSSTPNDDHGHGTHTMGTMVGSGGIGVAPGAKWAACKGCAAGSCTNSALTACGQFFACPNDGKLFFPKKDCSKAPHIINNSWGGAGNSSWYNDVIKAWNAAGIISTFSAGNSGPSCGTIGSPGDQNNTITVGSTDADDTLAPYSSVGPSQNGLLKPDIVGPGSAVISAWATADAKYYSLNGTSQASPHVAGVAALLKSKNMALTIQDIYKALTQNTDQSTLVGISQTCGNRSDSQWPNNSFGWGRVNALKAIQAV